MRKNIEENYKNEQTTDEAATRVLLVGVDDGSDDDFENSMEELGSLAQACNMEPAGMITQKMERGHAQGHGSSQEQGHLQQEQNTKKGHKSLYVGTGKLQEIKEAVQFMEADLVIFDDALTPSQLRNLQAELDKPIMDRSTLILNIFESRARTREAKMQVESAKLKYMLPRLVGMHEALTRQGGTSGSMSSRGAGEKKLELDRRRIEHRITELNRDLQEIAKERQVQRKQRQKARIPLVALVGYTNAGKSTVMNAMIDAYMENGEKKVVEKDMLFATLDTTVRRICTGNNRDFLLSDTVGFIHKLPHGLVKAFRSTLEEVENADLLLHIVDYSDPHFREQMDTTKQLLAELETGNIPMITVFNKADKCGEEYPKKAGGQRVFISAKDQESVRFLAGLILESIYKDYMESEFLIPYERGDVVSYFMEHSHMISSEFEEQGTRIQVRCHPADRDKYAAYSC